MNGGTSIAFALERGVVVVVCGLTHLPHDSKTILTLSEVSLHAGGFVYRIVFFHNFDMPCRVDGRNLRFG